MHEEHSRSERVKEEERGTRRAEWSAESPGTGAGLSPDTRTRSWDGEERVVEDCGERKGLREAPAPDAGKRRGRGRENKGEGQPDGEPA